ncbi:MAG TPA: type IV pilin protein [Candidatus Competibacteraceae bacterium]|nr:type IV pilin protein [Candidatus Competibacteraceae bacterium]
MRPQPSGHIPRRAATGFTLVELMIVVAVVAILAAIAYPSYEEQVRKGRRTDAKAALTELAQFMERTYVENKTYRPGGADPALPFTESPKEGATKFYTLSLSAISATTYTLQATPKGAQAGDSCGTLTLTNTGQKGAAKTGCW